MAQVHSRPSIPTRNVVRTSPPQLNVSQRVYITVGILFLILALVGLAVPFMAGMHFNSVHNVIHFALAGIILWLGFSRESRTSYITGFIVGGFLVTLGILGFLIGSPAYLTTMPSMPADQALWIVIPNTLELGTADHLVHLILGSATLMAGVNAKNFLNRIRIAVNK